MDGNERLCAMEPRLRLERFPPQTGIESGTARSVGQLLSRSAAGAPEIEVFGLNNILFIENTYM